MLEHAGIDIGQYHQAGAAGLARQSSRRSPVPPAMSSARPPALSPVSDSAKLFPESVRAAGHQIVHEIVSIGDRIEHATHPPAFSFRGTCSKPKSAVSRLSRVMNDPLWVRACC